MQEQKNNVALFGGGGSWGAYTAGVMCASKRKYDTYVGTSTGSLIALMCACTHVDDSFYERLEYEYKNTDNREMYGLFSPFDRGGDFRKSVLLLKAGLMLKNNTNHLFDIGAALMNKVKRNFKEEHYNALRAKKINVIVTTLNASTKNSKTKYISILDKNVTYSDFVSSVVASASIPFFAKPINMNGYLHVDGGVLDVIPSALFKGKMVDVYLANSLDDEEEKNVNVDGYMNLAGSLFGGMRKKIKDENLNDVEDARVFYSRNLGYHSADFNKSKMKEAFNLGVSDWLAGLVVEK